MKIPRAEQETVINIYGDDKVAVVYTSQPTMMKHLDDIVSQFPDQYQIETITNVSKTYKMPKSYVKFMKPRKLSAEKKIQIARINSER